MDEGKGGFVLGLLVGSLVGAAIAILMAPQSGEDTRKVLREKAGQAGVKAKDFAGDVRIRASELADEVKDRACDLANDFKERAGDLIEKGRKTFIEKKEELIGSIKKGDKSVSTSSSEA